MTALFLFIVAFLEFAGVKEQIKNNSSTDVKMEGNMKKEDLIALGLTEEQIEKARFDEVNNAKKQAEKDLSDRDKQLETLKNSTGDIETLKQTIETLQNENKAATDKYNAELAEIKLAGAVDTALLGADALNVRAVKALLDMSKIKMDGDVLLGINEQIESLKKAEDSKMLFKAVEEGKQKGPNFAGVKPGEGNTGNGESNAPKSLADAIMARFTTQSD